MALSLKGNTSSIKRMGRENSGGLMGMNMLESLETITKMVKE